VSVVVQAIPVLAKYIFGVFVAEVAEVAEVCNE